MYEKVVNINDKRIEFCIVKHEDSPIEKAMIYTLNRLMKYHKNEYKIVALYNAISVYESGCNYYLIKIGCAEDIFLNQICPTHYMEIDEFLSKHCIQPYKTC